MVNRHAVSVALAALLWMGMGEAVEAETITLEEALKRAKQHADIELADAETQAQAGRLTQAGTIKFNPALSGGLGPRFGGTQTVLDFELGLSQTFELGGKRRHRRSAADAKLRASMLRLSWIQERVALRVRRGYALASAAREVLDTTKEAEALALELKATSDERLKRGAGNLLEVNLAAAGIGQARRRRSGAEQTLIAAEYELAAAVGVDPETRLSPAIAASRPQSLSVEVEALVGRAMVTRYDQKALVLDEASAEASVRLADSLATPNLSLGGSYAHEEGTDQVLATLSIALPIWNRNKGGRAAARANRRRAEISKQYGQREVQRQVRTAVARYKAARDTVEAFELESVAKLADTLALTREAFERGKISMLEFNLLRTEFVDVRLAYLEAVAEEINARYQLERAVGEKLQ